MTMAAEWIQHTSDVCDNCADDNNDHMNGVYDDSADDDDDVDLAAPLSGCSQLAFQ